VNRTFDRLQKMVIFVFFYPGFSPRQNNFTPPLPAAGDSDRWPGDFSGRGRFYYQFEKNLSSFPVVLSSREISGR
jgi:hypothetical protein